MPKELMKLAFSVVRLGPERGGRRAIVIFSLAKRGEPNTLFTACMDDAGNMHQNVPFTRQELMEAAQKPVSFIEAPDERAPSAGGTGLVSPDGRAI